MNAVQRWGVLGIGMACFAVGCGESLPPVYPVNAVVRMDGEPFGPCSILLTPVATSGPGGRSSAGAVDQTGKVNFTTFKVGDGVPAGEYKVTVRSALTAAPPKPIPSTYQSDAKTPLRATVSASGANEVAFDLESKGGKADPNAGAFEKAFQSEAFSAGAGAGAE